MVAPREILGGNFVISPSTSIALCHQMVPDKSRLYSRINKDLQSESGLLKRKAPADANSSNGPPVRKVRPSNLENEADIQTLEKEIRALHWLARRKEQEWDQVRMGECDCCC